jgi:hypothetical protein
MFRAKTTFVGLSIQNVLLNIKYTASTFDHPIKANIPEQQTGKERNQGTTQNSRFEHYTHNPEMLM